jgi:aspartate kinase
MLCSAAEFPGSKSPVIGGFVGATEHGVTTTLGRGEAEQMAKAGAKVLHPASVRPAIRQGIPIVIRNSRNPGAAGTSIVRESPCDGHVMSIACRTDLTMLELAPRNTPVTSDFAREIRDEFQSGGVSFKLIATSSERLSLLADTAALTHDFQHRLGTLAQVEAQENTAMVSLIGQNAARNPSNLTRASQRLRRTRGGTTLAMCSDSRFAFTLTAEALKATVESLHEEFFAQPDPAFFVPDSSFVRVSGPEAHSTVGRRLVEAGSRA